MIRMAFLGSAAALALSLPAAAQQYGYNGYDAYGYQGQSSYSTNCESQRRSNQAGGAIVGALAGGLLGAVIADDGDDNHKHRYNGYGHNAYRGYGNGYHGGYRGHHKDNDDGDQLAGALIGALVGGVAGGALASSSTDCPTQVYGATSNPRYGNMGVPAPTRQPYGAAWDNGQGQYNAAYNTYDNGAGQNPYYDLRPGEELYGNSSYGNTAYGDPSYGATGGTQQGYNAGYSAPRDTGECRTVYRERWISGQRVSEPATACNVGGDRWEFVE